MPRRLVLLGIGDVKSGGGGDAQGSADAATAKPDAPKLRSPRMGATTGSVHADASLRPTFTWRATGGATKYELQVDDSCQTSSFKTCVFASPEIDQMDVAATSFTPAANLAVSLAQPVGRRYFWRVRACNDIGCSDWSDVWYLDVGRLPDDVNGDGYGDLLMGIGPTSSSATKNGGAWIDLGYPRGTSPPATVHLTDRSGANGSGFGLAVAMLGDVNGDGYADLMIGAPTMSVGTHTGNAYLYLGRATWPAAVSMETTLFQTQQSDPDEHFGATVAGKVDVNGDGYADIVVASGDPSATPAAKGYVHVYFGKPTWSFSSVGSDLLIPDATSDANAGWGLGLATADLDQDGLGDVIVGAPGVSSGTGAAAVYIGHASYPTTPATLSTPDVLLSGDDGTMSDYGLAIGACASPTAASLAIGAPFASHPQLVEGVVALYGGHATWPASITAADQTIVDPAGNPRDFAGQALRCADVTGDGVDDLVVGVPTADDIGSLALYAGATTLPVTSTATLSSGATTSDTLGYQIALTDFDGDGVLDVFASAPRLGAPTEAGTVVGYYGRGTWPGALTSADVTISNPSGVAYEWFGKALD